GRAAHGRPRGGQETAGAKGNNPPALPPRTRASSAAGRNLSTRESAVLPTRPTGSGKVRNPACGLVDNTARLRILTSRQFPHRPDIITDLLRADIFKNLQHPLSWRKGGTDMEKIDGVFSRGVRGPTHPRWNESREGPLERFAFEISKKSGTGREFFYFRSRGWVRVLDRPPSDPTLMLTVRR